MWFMTLFTSIWSNKKLLVYVLLFLLYPVCYLSGCVHGKTIEKNNYYKQTSGDQERQQKDNEKAANKAIANEADISKNVTQLDNSKEKIKEKINEFTKDNPCGGSKLSDDELRYINGLIEQANK